MRDTSLEDGGADTAGGVKRVLKLNNNTDEHYLNDSAVQNYKNYELPQKAVLSIVFYALDEYPKMIHLNKGWRLCIEEAIEMYWSMHDIEQRFNQIYGNQLSFLKSYISPTP